MKRIAITGALGHIAYSLIFRIAAGELLGPNQPIALHLIDIPELEPHLKGLVMELEDCDFSLLKEIKTGSSVDALFEGVHYAILVGSKPRGPNMERKDLLLDNGKIFISQGKALQRADKDVRVIVVGNPCNTNCLIAMHYAKDIPRERFHAMTRLDQNRAVFQLASKAQVSPEDVTSVAIWGNHSQTQVPDFLNAKIRNRPLLETISDRAWLEGEFLTSVQKRGAEVIAARGKSSAASAANAVIGSLRSILVATQSGDCISLAIDSTNNPYGIQEGLIFSFPCISKGKGDFEIVSGLKIDSFLQEKLKKTEKDLLDERDQIAHLLK